VFWESRIQTMLSAAAVQPQRTRRRDDVPFSLSIKQFVRRFLCFSVFFFSANSSFFPLSAEQKTYLPHPIFSANPYNSCCYMSINPYVDSLCC